MAAEKSPPEEEETDEYSQLKWFVICLIFTAVLIGKLILYQDVVRFWWWKITG